MYVKYVTPILMKVPSIYYSPSSSVTVMEE